MKLQQVLLDNPLDLHADKRPTENSAALPRYSHWCVLALTVLAGLLRAFRLDARSLNLDEGFTYYVSHVGTPAFWNVVSHGELNMALYYGMLRPLASLTASEIGLRCASVVFGTLTIPVIYLIGRRLFGTGAALMAALLLAIHPFALELSQRARSYSVATLLVTLAGFFLIELPHRSSKRLTVGYVVSAAAAVYSHFFSILAVGAQLVPVFAGILKIRRLYLLVILVMLGLLLLPCCIFLAYTPKVGLAWVPPPSIEQAKYTIFALTLSKGRSLPYFLAWIVAIAVAFRSKAEPGFANSFVMCWLFLPIIATIAASLFFPMLVARYLAVCIPAAVLLAARGIAALSTASRAAATVLLALIIFYSASTLGFYFRHPDYDENWRAAIAYVLSNAQPQDVVVIQRYTRLTFDFYAPRLHSLAGEHRVTDDLAAAAAQTPAPESLWVLDTKSAVPKVNEFLTGQRMYCGSTPAFATYDITVWRLRSCRDQ